MNEVLVSTALKIVESDATEYLRLPVELRAVPEIALAGFSKKAEDGTNDWEYYFNNEEDWIAALPEELMYSIDFHLKVVELHTFLATVGPEVVLASRELLIRIAELHGMDSFALCISGENYDDCVEANEKGDTEVSEGAADNLYSKLLFYKLDDYNRIKSEAERNSFTKAYLTRFKEPLSKSEHLLEEAVCVFGGDRSIQYLHNITDSPKVWAAAATASKELWLTVPDRLRTNSEFILKSVGSYPRIYFYLDDEEREENESLAFAFLDELSNYETPAYEVVDDWVFPESLSQDSQFSLQACKRWGDFSYFVPEPLRSDIDFIEAVSDLGTRCVVGLFMPASQSEEAHDWEDEQILEFFNARMQKNVLEAKAPGADISTKKAPFKV